MILYKSIKEEKKIDTSQGTNMVLNGSFVCLVLGLTECFGIVWVLTILIEYCLWAKKKKSMTYFYFPPSQHGHYLSRKIMKMDEV